MRADFAMAPIVQSSKPSKVSGATLHKINDLLVLPVQLPPQPAYPHSATHYLYVKPDTPRDNDEQSSQSQSQRSLFIGNVPISSTESTFRIFFKSLNPGAVVESVRFAAEAKKPTLGLTGEVVVQGTKIGVPIGVLRGKKRKRGEKEHDDEIVKQKLQEMELPSTWRRSVHASGSSAVVTFVDRDAMLAAWKASLRVVKDGRQVKWPDAVEAEEDVGIDRYRSHQDLTYPSHPVLQSSINAYLSHFATLESLRAKHLAKQRNVPDEDGFVTVARGGRSGPARIEQAQAAQARLKEREQKRAAENFYKFQSREARKKREAELKVQHKRDVEKIRDMKRRRGVIVPET